MARRLRPPFANAVFFPAAALYGAVTVPWWALGFIGWVPLPPGLETPAGHAHEMLFGYAFAVVAGYLLGPQPLGITLSLLALWLGARIGFLVAPGSWLAIASVAMFAFGVAARVVPRFNQAKKWRNRTVAPVVAALAILAAAASVAFGTGMSQRMLLISLVLLSVLVFFMGGRIIAPAVAGHLIRQGRPLDARVQPALEGAALVCLLVAFAFLVVPMSWGPPGSGLLLLCAGILTVVRLCRWHLWRCRDRIDLLVLALGYGWLAVGLVLLGAALAADYRLQGALHALAVGAIGTLTVAVMARTRLLYRFRDANRMPSAHVAAFSMTIAAVARLLSAVAAFADFAVPLLVLSAFCWSAALLVLLWVLVRTVMPERAAPSSGKTRSPAQRQVGLRKS